MKRRVIARHNKNYIYKNVIKPLKKHGVRFDSILFESGYFIFNFEDNSVCEFKLRGLPQVLFGVWNVNGKIEIFGDDIIHIDKFKPSQCVNFSIEDIINLYWDYKNKKIILQNIVMDIFDNDYDDIYYTDESKLNRISSNEFDKIYENQYNIEIFKLSHSSMTPEEFDRCEYYKNKFINELSNNPFVKHIWFYRTPEFYKDYGSIEIFLTEETHNWTDEEFDNFYISWKNLIEWGDDTYSNEFSNKNLTGLSFCFHKILWQETEEELNTVIKNIYNNQNLIQIK